MFPLSLVKVCFPITMSPVITLCFSILETEQTAWCICKVGSGAKEEQLEHLQRPRW